MAIGFARIEFVQRSNGKTACAKAAYNARTRIEFEGNCALDSQTFNWSSDAKPPFHEILLPSNAHEMFKSPQILWNAVEAKEKKHNSQVAMEVVLALPDDKTITLDDRIHLTKTFVQTHFVDKGLAAQIDIHSPERKIQITRNNQELGLFKGMYGNVVAEKNGVLAVQFNSTRTISFDSKEFTGFAEKENNWHAHVLITTRRFKTDGLELEDHKARDLMPRVCNGKVVSGPDWGKLWTDHQNQYFEEKGLNLRVDVPGIQPQEHLGPIRMRGRALSLLEEHSRLLEENVQKSMNPAEILEKLTERQSVFTQEDVERFLQKHLPFEHHDSVRQAFWTQKEVVPLVDKITNEATGKFSSENVLEEEKRILRLADHLESQETFKADLKKAPEYLEPLNDEQQKAFAAIVRGKKLVCLQGYAGTGKSHLLASLMKFYSSQNYRVRGFGPDSATADILKEKGFHSAENIYRFLFGMHNSRRHISHKNEVWILDEAGKLGNRPLLELLKYAEKYDVKVILAGDHAQLSSVERGGMFRLFCERYSPQILGDIQRQKKETHRAAAKDLATGNLGPAIDKLASASSIRWSSTKKEAMENLISSWTHDTRSIRSSATLLIAHTNDEVRVLNEMVRLVRKQRGELSGEEFSCETTMGKVYLSMGDRIEFRKNDKELVVTNGLSGVLVETKPDRFVVAVEAKDKKIRHIEFDPREYHSYQLGYASTYFRSQGRTVDRAYVLHSPALNKRLFYVGLTRHVKEAYYFVSKDQAYCLADLKRQASRDNLKENTNAYTTLDEIHAQQIREQKVHQIQELKDSDSFLDKVKGYGLAAYDLVKTKTGTFRERIQDRLPAAEFFNPKIEKPFLSAFVEAVPSEDPQQPEPHVSNVEHPNTPRRNTKAWASLDSEKKAVLESYFSSLDEASALHRVVAAEADGNPLPSAAHFKEWQELCAKRNASAHTLAQKTSADELKILLGKKTAEFIMEQASKHQKSLEREPKVPSHDIQDKLKENIEPLLYRLFPDGPIRKDRNSFRFGAKGSLSIKVSGDKAGQFFDFERQEGGGLLKLIQRELGLGRLEAQEWAKEFVGVSHDHPVPKSFQRAAAHSPKESEWVAVKPNSSRPAPRLEDLPAQKLHHFYEEVARHPYRDENSELLYYRLRLRDKQDPSKKITPPLSYGYWKSNPEKLLWEIKGFDSCKTVLYNLPHLKEDPKAPILIVEGEKTADQAKTKFPGEAFVVITWPNGSGSAKKADWTPLFGRDVVIWPDNDKPGFQAADDICRELKKVGIQSLRVVNPSELQKHFPEKWDLADPLPQNMPPDFPKQLLQASTHKGIDPQQVLARLSTYESTFQNRCRTNEILWRVDERLRPELEQKLGNQFRKINEIILNETARLLLKNKNPKHTDWQILVYEAAHGKEPTSWEIEKITQTVEQSPLRLQLEKKNEAYASLALDKAFTSLCESAFSGHKIQPKDLEQKFAHEEKVLQRQNDMQQSLETGRAERQKVHSMNPNSIQR